MAAGRKRIWNFDCIRFLFGYYGNMREVIGEKIDVLAVHTRTKGVQIRKILWSGREYKIDKVGYYFKIKNGATILHVFTANSGELDLRLSLNSENLQWCLEEISDGMAS